MGRDTLKTAKEWYALGCLIRKSEKHKYRNTEGVCVFSPDQVREKPRRFLGWAEGSDPYDEDYDDPFIGEWGS